MINTYTGVYIVLFLTYNPQGKLLLIEYNLLDSGPTIEWFSK